MRPRDDLAVRGRSTEVARPTESQDSSDVTPTAVTPNPLKTTPSPPAPAAQQVGPPTTAPPAAAPTNVPSGNPSVPGSLPAEPAAPIMAPLKEPAVAPTAQPAIKTKEPAVQSAEPTLKATEESAPKSLLDIGLEASKAKTAAAGGDADVQASAHPPTST